MNTEQLLKIKDTIDKAKQEASEIRGKISNEEDGMFRDFKVKTISDADNSLKEIDNELNEIEKEFDKESDELEKAYPWDLS